MRRYLIPLIAMTLLAGCGGGGSSSSPPALTPDENMTWNESHWNEEDWQ